MRLWPRRRSGWTRLEGTHAEVNPAQRKWRPVAEPHGLDSLNVPPPVPFQGDPDSPPADYDG